MLKINIYGIIKKVETTTIQYYNFYFQEGKEMSFCKYCGKQLQDGEVCTCQQAQQPAGTAQPQQGFNQQAAQQTFQQGAGQQTYQQAQQDLISSRLHSRWTLLRRQELMQPLIMLMC